MNKNDKKIKAKNAKARNVHDKEDINKNIDNKKKVLSIITLALFILVVFLAFLVLSRMVLKTNFEKSILPFANKNSETIFNINQIVFFSNCDAKNKNISTTNYTLENIYQYTDIAFFIDSPQEEKTSKNTLKNVTIENINFTTPPSMGEPALYFKSINNFAKNELNDENKIEDKLDFSITSEDSTDLSTPVLYNNLANPITLSYINSNIKTDYTITDTSTPITYDGTLLNRCSIPLEDINCSFSFDVFVTNNQDEKYKCTVFVDVPLSSDEGSIDSTGSVTLKKDVNFSFYRYE